MDKVEQYRRLMFELQQLRKKTIEELHQKEEELTHQIDALWDGMTKDERDELEES